MLRRSNCASESPVPSVEAKGTGRRLGEPVADWDPRATHRGPILWRKSGLFFAAINTGPDEADLCAIVPRTFAAALSRVPLPEPVKTKPDKVNLPYRNGQTRDLLTAVGNGRPRFRRRCL
jgi:hypothetical protein